jgi:protein-tyrosine phosphatase
MLGQSEGQVLILDIRPPSSYVQSHLPGALSLPVPSTLLKRPAFTVEKLAQMLSARAASAIVDFKTAQEIVIVDQDSPIAAPGSVIVGLASKFGNAMTEAESRAKQGHVHFVKGGMAACSDLEGVTLETGQEESSEDETDAQVAGSNGPGSPTEQPGRMIGRLDRMAFSSGEKMYSTVLWLTPADAVCIIASPLTASASGVGTRRANAPKSLTLPNTPANALGQSGGSPMQVLRNEGDGPTSGTQRSATTSPRSGPRPSPGRVQMTEKQKLQPANPFFDNIRQNLELAHGGILERIPLELPDDVKARANELPDFLRDMLTRPSPEVAEQLAKEFERVERDEQKRLQGIMEWHSRGTRLAESQGPVNPGGLKRLASTGYIRTSETQADVDKREQDDYFPFSITAGVERGSKNR